MPDTHDEPNPDQITIDEALEPEQPGDSSEPQPPERLLHDLFGESNASTAGEHSDQVDDVHQVRIQHEYSNSDNSPPHSTVTTHPMSLHDAIELLRSLL